MKVFISWSGQHSKKLGEALRDWLPGVLQLVRPYFTPSDLDKGTRWPADVSKELSESQIGILCITQDNIHSDWILFEAGALSKSLEQSHVCPVLFGITNNDLAGPLKQFQTTEFAKDDMHRLLSLINKRLGEDKLPQKTLDTVFKKWWPDLEGKINEILAKVGDPETPLRSDRDLLEEILQLSRAGARIRRDSGLPIGLIPRLLSHYIALHDQQVEGNGGYQATLDCLKNMHRAVEYLARHYTANHPDVNELIDRFNDLSYTAVEKSESGDDIPF